MNLLKIYKKSQTYSMSINNKGGTHMKKLIFLLMVVMAVSAFGKGKAGSRSYDHGGGLIDPAPYEFTLASK